MSNIVVRRAKWRTKPRTRHDRHNWIVEDVLFGRQMVYSHFPFAIHAADLLARRQVISPLGLVGFQAEDEDRL